VYIKDIKPLIWRRLRIPGNITFQQLHQVIQAAFNWFDYHWYRFEFDRIVVTVPDEDCPPEELYGEDIKEMDSGATTVDELFKLHDKCEYVYDYGDSWCHDIVIEKRIKDTKNNAIPVCLAGARHRPSEDVGGVGGYEDFLRIIMNKGHPERKEMLAWAEKDTNGRIFDPEYFDIKETNRRLEYALEDDAEHARELLFGDDLNGTISYGWNEIFIISVKKRYTMEHIGRLLYRLDEGCKVTIKAEPNKKYK
jgi:hypothetical protein